MVALFVSDFFSLLKSLNYDCCDQTTINRSRRQFVCLFVVLLMLFCFVVVVVVLFCFLT